MHTTLFLPSSGPYPAAPRLPEFDPATLAGHGADAHWITRDDAGEPVARASVWHRTLPAVPWEKLGIIGHYAAADAEAGAALLAHLCADLAADGCTLAVGPMDGTTWRSYRFVTALGQSRPFFLEPHQPSDWPDHWSAAKFLPYAGYHSTVSDDLAAGAADPRLDEASQRARAAGIRLRPVNMTQWDAELRRLYAVAAVSFRDNFLYTPLDEPEFLALYQPLRPLIRPELVLLAEDAAGQPVGFVLGLPDRLDPTGETFIVKTVAVLPEHTRHGLGRVLVAGTHAAAQELGFRRAIHALMHDGNVSRKISARFGSRLLRRYTLFSRRLP